MHAERRHCGHLGGQRLAAALQLRRVGLPHPALRRHEPEEDRSDGGEGRRRQADGEREREHRAPPAGVPVRQHDDQRDPGPAGVREVVHIALHPHHLRERDEVVQHGVDPEPGELQRPGRDAEDGAEVRHKGARAQRVLGRPELADEVGHAAGPGPAQGGDAEAAQVGRVALRREAHPLGRGEREPALQLLREQARAQRVGADLPAGGEDGQHPHPLHERVQRAGAARRRERRAQQVRRQDEPDPQLPRQQRAQVGRGPREPLLHAQHPLHEEQPRYAGQAEAAHVAHGGGRGQEPQPGEVPGAGAEGRVRAPQRRRHHHVGGVAREGLLHHVPHGQQLQEPPRRRPR
jgi:hypothetical protein